MTPHTAALLYAGLTLLPTAMQIALTTGAPLGRFTVGGRFPGRLPPLWRGLALVQAGVLIGMALVVLDRGGVLPLSLPAWLFWVVLTLSLTTFLANAASPSRPERLLWGPVTFAMVVSALGVAFL